jgi:hypothetical protein
MCPWMNRNRASRPTANRLRNQTDATFGERSHEVLHLCEMGDAGRLHGGLSTGPKIPEGRRWLGVALLMFGRYTKEAKQERLECHKLMHGGIERLRQIQDVGFGMAKR